MIENNSGLPVWGDMTVGYMRAATAIYVLTGRCHIIALTERVQSFPHTGTLPSQPGHVSVLKQRTPYELPIPNILVR